MMFPMFCYARTLRGFSAAGGLFVLAACSTAQPTQSGFLSDYSQLEARTDTVRAKVAQYRNETALADIERVHIEPAVLEAAGETAFTETERTLILNEVNRQICYEISRRFTVSSATDTDAARLRVAATRVLPTNTAGSVASAVVDRFIPGPIGLRVPGSTGGLAAEAELVSASGEQVAAIVWARDAQVVGTDNPSLSRVGDAHRLAAPFADLVAAAMTPQGRDTRSVPSPDPCAHYGPRIRPEGFITRAITGLYAPELSGGTNQTKAEPTPEERPDQSGPD